MRRDGVLVHREEWVGAGQPRAVIANLSQADRRLAAGEQPRLSLSETLRSMEPLDKKPQPSWALELWAGGWRGFSLLLFRPGPCAPRNCRTPSVGSN